ncbi:tRNA A64-2'-O-ribosylphosphate transferase [Ceratobasidium sp. AG-Ba]|nr:tRNA A64-2'-O-ribosylphosphate transferase [Ceratobasidium sp. AG-Ba]
MAELRSSGLNVLRQEMTNTYNRLRSINQDAIFVRNVVNSGTLPVAPNLRCGAWYVDPTLMKPDVVSAAYFKSTDGHTSQWAFNLRRANLHLLPIIVSNGGIILVDSTRRGKRHPDALSRTVPIWCAVINRALGLDGEHAGLFTPPDAVSPSEHAQMDEKIEGWANELKASAYTLLTLSKPLRPFWISPDSTNPKVPFVDESNPFYPVVCLSASQRVQDGVDRRLGFTYVQGSGDDHELWSHGLTPSIFWANKSRLLECPQDELEDLIKELLEDSKNDISVSNSDPIQATNGRLRVGIRSSEPISPESGPTLILVDVPARTAEPPATYNTIPPIIDSTPLALPNTLEFPSYYPKQHPVQFLTHTLPTSLKFIQSHLTASPDSRVTILCKDGKDLSIGIATAALALYFNDSGAFVGSGTEHPNKESIRRRLQWVLSSRPGANPARATLKRINEYLMSPNRPSLQYTNI